MAYTLLSPVTQEELRISFGAKKPYADISDPLSIFSPTIQTIKKFAIGKYFWFIIDTQQWKIIQAGGAYDELTPLHHDDLVEKGPDVLMQSLHPEDAPPMLAFSNHWIHFLNSLPIEHKAHYKPTIFVRSLNKDKQYRWVMVQYLDQILNENHELLYGLTLYTDVSHLKKDGRAMMTILNTSNERCQEFFCIDGMALLNEQAALPIISNRELQVLHYLAIGYSSKQIADTLHISKFTVDNHRQNLLAKTNKKSTAELVAFAISKGYL